MGQCSSSDHVVSSTCCVTDVQRCNHPTRSSWLILDGFNPRAKHAWNNDNDNKPPLFKETRWQKKTKSGRGVAHVSQLFGGERSHALAVERPVQLEHLGGVFLQSTLAPPQRPQAVDAQQLVLERFIQKLVPGWDSISVLKRRLWSLTQAFAQNAVSCL